MRNLKLALACLLLASPTARAQRPNIVVFLVDDMGWQETSVPFHSERTALNERYHTPNMERLAAQGMKFTQAYAYALCSPSRVSLMTGLSASRHRVTCWTLRKDQEPDPKREKVLAGPWNRNGWSSDPEVPFSVSAPALPALLKNAGYRTIHAGKAHFGAKGTPGEDPRSLGFDVNIAGHAAGGPGSYHGERNYSAEWRGGDRIWDVPGLAKYHGTETNLTEAITREALAAVDAALEAEQPFFLYLSHYAIHAPWEEDARFLAKYTAAGLPEREAIYASMVESMDHSLGDVLDRLDEREIAENTIVLFLSDNGSPGQMPRNLPLRGHKLTPYEGGIRVPLIARWPGVTEAGSVCAEPLIIDDLFPTLATMGGVPQKDWPKVLDGESAVTLLAGGAREGELRSFFWHYPNTYDQPPYTAMRRGKWKLIYHHTDRRFELFDLEADLSEASDVSAEHAELVKDLAQRMHVHLDEMDAVMSVDRATRKPIELPLEAIER